MSYRFMRMIIFFDLPTETPTDRKNYRRFRKTLIKNGFIMMQESVYCKLLITPSAADAVAKVIRAGKSPSGIVQMLIVTEKQFSEMEYIVGAHHSEVISSDERLVML